MHGGRLEFDFRIRLSNDGMPGKMLIIATWKVEAEMCATALLPRQCGTNNRLANGMKVP